MSNYSHYEPCILNFDDYMESIFCATFKHHSLMEYYAVEGSPLEGLLGKLYGFDADSYAVGCEPNLNDFSHEQLAMAEEKFKKLPIYGTLAALYQYAVNGIRPEDSEYGVMDDHWIGMIQDSIIYLQSINSDFSKVAIGVLTIPELAMLRFGIDGDLDYSTFSSDFEPVKIIALMANLDERTVRNAQAQGAFCDESGDLSFIAIKNWLLTKKGFVKTKGLSFDVVDKHLSDAKTPGEFGEILRLQRQKLGIQFDVKVFISKHHTFSKNTIELLEQGVFNLPLSTVSIIATHYEIEEKELLEAVMRIFFGKELALLRG